MKKPDLKLKKPELKLKMPELKLKRPQSTRTRSSAPSVKPPKFIADLYADLRDRRLLPLVALLLVAIVAAPILLSGGSGEEGPEPAIPSPAPSGAAAQASFAVVPAAPTLRDYHRRLGHRQARDPFQQPVTPEASGAAGSGEGSGSTASGKAGEGSGSATPTETPVAVEGGSEGSGQGKEPKTTTKVVVQDKVLGYEIDAKAGFVGHVKPRDGIEPSTKLPNAKNPVIVFMGFSKDNKRALFLMSRNVTAYYGKAHCALDKQACQLVELKPGNSATFAYGYGEARYKLTLRRIVPVVSTREAAATVTTGADDNGGVPAGK